MRQHLEDDIQKQLFTWIRLATPRIPQLALAFHPANGGRRDAHEAARLKGMGVRAGVPDVMIPWPKFGPLNQYTERTFLRCGLAIELKSAKGRTTDAQDEWIKALRLAGWDAFVCRSFDEARRVIADYFEVKP